MTDSPKPVFGTDTPEGVEWVWCATHQEIGLCRFGDQLVPSCGCAEYTMRVKEPIRYIKIDIEAPK